MDIKFVRGNPGNLSGDAILFSEFANPYCNACEPCRSRPDDKYLEAVYITFDRQRFLDITNMDPEKLKEADDIISSGLVHLLDPDFHEETVINEMVRPRLYSTNVKFPSTDALPEKILNPGPKNILTDIVQTDSFGCVTDCRMALEGLHNIYRANFYSQINSLNISHNPDENLRKMSRVTLMRDLTTIYIKPLVDAERRGDLKALNYAEHKFLEMARVNGILDDALEVCHTIRNFDELVFNSLLTPYIMRIVGKIRNDPNLIDESGRLLGNNAYNLLGGKKS